MKRVMCIICLCALMCTALSGCSEKTDIESYGIVAGAALDLNPDGRLLLTVEVLDTSSGKADGQASSKCYRGLGDTVSQAARQVITTLGKPLYWAHAQVIVVGERFARKGIQEAVDWIMRSRAARISVPIAVAAGSDAGSLLDSKMPPYYAVSFGLRELIETSAEQGLCPDMPAFVVFNKANGESRFALAAAVTAAGGSPALAGGAVFDGYRLDLLLTPEQSQIYMLAQGKVRKGSIEAVGCTFGILRADDSVKLSRAGDRYAVEYRIMLRLTVEEGEPSGGQDELDAMIADSLYRRFCELAELWRANSADFLEVKSLMHAKDHGNYHNLDRADPRGICDITFSADIYLDDYGRTEGAGR